MTKPAPTYQPRFVWTLAVAAVFVGALLTGGGCTKKKNHGALHAERPQENFSPAGCESEAFLQKQGRFLVEHIPESWPTDFDLPARAEQRAEASAWLSRYVPDFERRLDFNLLVSALGAMPCRPLRKPAALRQCASSPESVGELRHG